MEIAFPHVNWVTIAPQIIILAAAMLVLLVGSLSGSGRRTYVAYISLSAVIVAAIVTFYAWDGTEPRFQTMVAFDNMAAFLNLVFLLVAALSILISIDYVPENGLGEVEYYGLLLVSLAGMMFLGSATNVIMIFVGLELLSIPLYVLSGFNQRDVRSGEAALKYFLLGAFASGFLLYGLALLYGGTGTTSLAGIAEAIGAGNTSPFIAIGMGLVIVGFGFKTALVPFHMWTPDVYQGAPTTVTAFMSVGTKAAAFAAMIRLLAGALPAFSADWGWILAVLAVLTMTLGNFAALAQTNVKRMLAYSSIAHAGYILVGLVAGSIAGLQGVLFYLAAYAFMNIGAFAILIAVSRGSASSGEDLDSFGGLAAIHPWLAAAMALFLFSLAGIPPLVGFLGKIYVFAAAVERDWWWLAAVAVVNSVISAYYYLRVVGYMYLRDGRPRAVLHVSPGLAVAVVLALVGTIVIGLWPSPVLGLTQLAFLNWGL